MIHWSELRVVYDAQGRPISGEVCFSHVDDVTGDVRHFAVERIERDIRNGTLNLPIVETPINDTFARFSFTQRGVEKHRIIRLLTTPTEISHYPVVFAHFPGVGRDVPDSEYLMIDGAHRYCASAVLGWKSIRGYVMEPEQWEPYLIDIPEIAEQTRAKMDAQARGVPIDSNLDANGKPLPRVFR
jgi:hypothetical protein